MPRKPPRDKNFTDQYLAGRLDEDRLESGQRFSDRSKNAQRDKTQRTQDARAAGMADDLESLAVGRVIEVHSLFLTVRHEGVDHLCVVRKTFSRLADTGIVVGDSVRFRLGERRGDTDAPEGIIEQVLPRRTLITRSDSFKAIEQHPIVANAEQMLIVASLRRPRVKWGLIDRMLIAARAGGLVPIICLNKLDLAEAPEETDADLADARAALGHYGSMGYLTLQTSVDNQVGLEALADLLRGRSTVLAGHSGVGKSSLIRAIQPSLDLRVAAVSGFNDKGRHTTSSARIYPLDIGGEVIDTPGVKLFGLWGVTADNLDEFFPDATDGTAPPWRIESRERIALSLGRRR